MPAVTALMNGGTTGTKSGTVPITGSVATGWSGANQRGGSTNAATIHNSPGAYSRQTFTITPANDGYSDAGGGAHELDFNAPSLTAGLPPAGSWVRAIHVETPNLAFGTGPSVIYSQFTINNGTTAVAVSRGQNEFNSGTNFANYGRGGYWLGTPPVLVPTASFNNFKFGIVARWQKTIGTPVTITFDRLIIRQVTDPPATWNLPQ